jgi:hypothetical protein
MSTLQRVMQQKKTEHWLQKKAEYWLGCLGTLVMCESMRPSMSLALKARVTRSMSTLMAEEGGGGRWGGGERRGGGERGGGGEREEGGKGAEPVPLVSSIEDIRQPCDDARFVPGLCV